MRGGEFLDALLVAPDWVCLVVVDIRRNPIQPYSDTLADAIEQLVQFCLEDPDESFRSPR